MTVTLTATVLLTAENYATTYQVFTNLMCASL
jgi:hypothetical protein